MSFNRNKLTFKVDEITGEIIQPQVILCDRQLNKIGEIFPIRNLRVKCLLNGADEVSFSTSKEAAMYDRIRDYSVVFVRGFGYFEVSPSVNSSFDETKEVQGSSLGEAELSQLLCTLECNTENDLENSGKGRTILCDKKNEETSLIHRILSNYAPTYEVGDVDDTIGSIQRTFSFSNLDIMSCFSEIAEELNCIFDVSVRKNENGTVVRQVNIYDAQFCRDCRSRTIINGKCHACGSTNIGGIGEDTTIKIGTDNLSDEITLSSDGKMKNCFIVEGGDELMTNTINGITPSGTNKLYMFSEETINSFSPALRKKYAAYMTEYGSQKSVCEEIYETECNIIDLILYLQSGRMPTPETDHRDLHKETAHIIQTYNKYFPHGLGMLDSADTSSRNSIIRQLFSVFADKGYAVRQEGGTYNADSKKWTGSIIVYETGNNDSNAVIAVSEQSSTITYSDSNENEQAPLQIQFTENHETYLEQTIALRTKSYENLNHLTGNQPKDWQKYSLNRLTSFCDGYRACKDVLEEEKKNSELKGIIDGADKLLEEYNSYIAEISEYTIRLENIIYYLYSYYGKTDSVPSQIIFKTRDEAFQNMTHYIRYGTWTGGTETENTDAALYCSKCGSTNVTINGCNNCGGEVVTYSALAKAVYSQSQDKTANLLTQRRQINDSLNLKTYLCDKPGDDSLYRELCSYIREDVYTNSNFISDGLEKNNTKLISQAKELLEKAEQELARACVPQHTLTGNVYAFTAYSSLNKNDFPIRDAYSKFILGNFMRFISGDGTVYKLRLSSEEFSWGDSDVSLNVEFTDVVRSADGTISDIETLIQHVGNLATSFDSVKKQAEQGETASKTFEAIKNEGLYSALGNVLNAKNQDVQVTENGITLREYDHELDDYDEHQMKLVNRNIVMTEDGWKSAKLAIGLGYYNNVPQYGVWADLLIGTLIAGKKLLIRNDKGSVEITGDGITIKKGVISWNDVNSPEIKNINGLAQAIAESEQNANNYTKEQYNALETSLTDAYKSYANSMVSKLDSAVANYLKLPGATTLIGENYVISPFIEGGYMNITGSSDAVSNQVIIDPQNLAGTDYIFAVKHGNEFAVGIKPNGTANFNGDITATSLTLKGCKLPYSNISGTPEIPSDIKDLKDSNNTLANILYKGDIEAVTGKDENGNTYTTHTVPGKDGKYITYTTYDKNDYVLLGKSTGTGIMGGKDTYTCISKDGLLEANNAIIYGTIYATDGEFKGSIVANKGEIGGWNIESEKLLKKVSDSNNVYISELDSTNHRFRLTNKHKNELASDTYDTMSSTDILHNGITCKFSEQVYGNYTRDKYVMKLNADGIIYKDRYNDEIIFRFGRYDPYGEVFKNPDKFAAEFKCPVYFNPENIFYGDKPLKNTFCVVKTGTNTSMGTGDWVEFSATFGETYETEPFINVMSTSNFKTENIKFIKFFGSLNEGYTGFLYSVYCPDTLLTYNTKWFAVGNIKR